MADTRKRSFTDTDIDGDADDDSVQDALEQLERQACKAEPMADESEALRFEMQQKIIEQDLPLPEFVDANLIARHDLHKLLKGTSYFQVRFQNHTVGTVFSIVKSMSSKYSARAEQWHTYCSDVPSLKKAFLTWFGCDHESIKKLLDKLNEAQISITFQYFLTLKLWELESSSVFKDALRKKIEQTFLSCNASESSEVNATFFPKLAMTPQLHDLFCLKLQKVDKQVALFLPEISTDFNVKSLHSYLAHKGVSYFEIRFETKPYAYILKIIRDQAKLFHSAALALNTSGPVYERCLQKWFFCDEEILRARLFNMTDADFKALCAADLKCPSNLIDEAHREKVKLIFQQAGFISRIGLHAFGILKPAAAAPLAYAGESNFKIDIGRP